MNSSPSITLETVSKAYLLFDNPKDRLRQMIWRQKKLYREFWALRDINLKIAGGEAVGIVGRNGSGKSTLLHIITGTLRPTSGSVQTRGRISPLLELGTGFNPEFTGRENLTLNAALLGMNQTEIEERQDAILAFADIGTFIDQPVKTYSSGMAARLAFATAINVDPEILIVDEILAVGDAAFQRKCFARIEQLRAKGVTIIFVSHSAGNVLELCNRAIFLDAGEMLMDGDPKDVITCYQRLIFSSPAAAPSLRNQIRERIVPRVATAQDAPATAPESREQGAASFDPNLRSQSTISYANNGALIRNPRLLDTAGQQVNELVSGATYFYVFEVDFVQSARKVRFGMLLKTTTGLELGGLASHPQYQGIHEVEAGSRYSVRFTIQADLNQDRTYFLNAGVLGLNNGEEIYLHRLVDAVAFRIEPVPNNKITGYVNFSAENGCKIELA